MVSEQDHAENRDENMQEPRTQPEYRLGKDIVAAWFVTIINPMIEDLSRQHEYLRERHYTWRFRPAAFEVLGLPAGRIAPEYFPNFEHLTTVYSDILNLVDVHGDRLLELTRACADLQHVLEHSQELDKLFAKATSEEMLREYGKSVEDLFGAYPLDDHLSYLGQLIINRTGDLPYYYTTHPLWNRFGGEFLSLLAAPGIREYSMKADAAADGLREAGERLMERLKSIRLELAHGYGVPFVPPGVYRV